MNRSKKIENEIEKVKKEMELETHIDVLSK